MWISLRVEGLNGNNDFVDSPIILSGLFVFRVSIRPLSSVDCVCSAHVCRFANYPQWTVCFPCVDSPIILSGLFSVCRFAYYPQWTVFRVSIHLLSSVDCVFSVCRFAYYPQWTVCLPKADSPIILSGLCVYRKPIRTLSSVDCVFSVCRFAYYPQWTVFRVSIHLLSSVDCVFPCFDSLLSSVDCVFTESRFAYYPQWTVCFPCVTISTNDLCRSLLHPKYSDESPAEKGSTLKGNH